MLAEIEKTRQIPGEPLRRWFSDEKIDLIVWYSSQGAIIGFQLCYREWPQERALTWLSGRGFAHNRIDDGERRPDRHKMTPILLPDGDFEKQPVLKSFERRSQTIDPSIARIVITAIRAYPNGRWDQPDTA
jgi:hypothetical protein